MNQLRRVIPATIFSIPFLLFLFVLVLVASYLLADNSISGLFSPTMFSTPRGFLLLVVAPLSLILFLCLFFYMLFSHTWHTGRSSRFGRKIFVLLAVLVTVTSLSITLIVGRFTGIAVSSGFDGDVPEALRAAREISDLYQNERKLAIERVSFRFFNGLAIVNQRAMRRDWMDELRVVDAYAAACQVYREDAGVAPYGYEAVIETGDMDYFFPREELYTVRDGFFPPKADDRVLRYGKLVRYSNETYVCVYSSLIPTQLFARDALIRTVYEESRVINALDRIMPYLGLWIFFMFCLPPVMMAVLLGYVLVMHLVTPLGSAAEFSGLLVEGNRSFRLVPKGGDEAGVIAENLNRLAEKPAESEKRGDKKASLRL